MPQRSFSFGKGFYVYCFLLVFAIIFTQALRSSVSIVFLWFTLLLPFAMLAELLISRGAVSVFLTGDEKTAQKNDPTEYEFTVWNSSLLPLPYVEAIISVPSASGVKSVEKHIEFSILPKGKYVFSNSVVFKYRGKYIVGVGDIYVTDALGFYRIKKSINVYESIFVMPRKCCFDHVGVNSPSDLPSESNLIVNGNESSELNRIREYRYGDSLKRVHWKLSSKMSELQVNEYKPNSGRNVFIFCDYSALPDDDVSSKNNRINTEKKKDIKKKRAVKLKIVKRADSSKLSTAEKLNYAKEAAASRAQAASLTEKSRRELNAELGKEENVAMRANEETVNAGKAGTVSSEDYFRDAAELKPEFKDDMNAFVSDGVSELAIGAVLHELEMKNSVTLMWFDSRNKLGFSGYTVDSYDDFDRIFMNFATAPVADTEFSVTRLAELVDSADDPTFIFVTARAELSNVSDFVDVSNSVGAEAVEILFFNPKERYASSELRSEYTEFLRARFEESNITLTEARIN